jgi:hypothetical protein
VYVEEGFIQYHFLDSIFPLHLRSSFRPPLVVRLPGGNQVFHASQPIRYASSRGQRHARCTRNLNVREVIRSRRRRGILQFPAETIRQAS